MPWRTPETGMETATAMEMGTEMVMVMATETETGVDIPMETETGTEMGTMDRQRRAKQEQGLQLTTTEEANLGAMVLGQLRLKCPVRAFRWVNNLIGR